MRRVARVLGSNTASSLQRISSITASISRARRELSSLQQSISQPESHLPSCHWSHATVLNSKSCFPVNHPVPPSPHIEHFLQFQTVASTNQSLLRAFSLWSAHHQLNDWSEVSLHNVSSFYQEKTLSTRYSQSPVPRSGPPLDLACYVARAFHVQHAIATCLIFSPFFSYSSSDPSTPVWTTSHTKNMFASPASLLWVDPFAVPMSILHDVFHTLHNPTPSGYVLLIDTSLDEYTSCVTNFYE